MAVVGIEHLNKHAGNGLSAIYRIQGSIGIVGAARCAWGVVRDPHDDESRILQVIKNNLARDIGATGLRYKIVDGVLEWDDTPVEASLDDIMNFVPKGKGPREEAMEWLTGFLAEPQPATAVFEAGEAIGFSKRTIRRAQNELGIKPRQEEKRWIWRLPEEIA